MHTKKMKISPCCFTIVAILILVLLGIIVLLYPTKPYDDEMCYQEHQKLVSHERWPIYRDMAQFIVNLKNEYPTDTFLDRVNIIYKFVIVRNESFDKSFDLSLSGELTKIARAIDFCTLENLNKFYTF